MRDVWTVGCGTHLVPVVVGDARALRVVLGKPPVHDSLGVVRAAREVLAAAHAAAPLGHGQRAQENG